MQTIHDSQTDSGRYSTLTVDELLRHYPWFSREEIADAMKLFGERRERVLAYLDMKSGHWSYFDLLD